MLVLVLASLVKTTLKSIDHRNTAVDLLNGVARFCLIRDWNHDSFFQSQSILSAVLTLVQELDHTSLLTVRKEIDQQLQDLDQMDSDSQDRDENGEEKEAIAD